jgi:hypothetical protein
MSAKEMFEEANFKETILPEEISYIDKYEAVGPDGEKETIELRIRFDLINKRILSNIVWTSDKRLDKAIKKKKKELGW